MKRQMPWSGAGAQYEFRFNGLDLTVLMVDPVRVDLIRPEVGYINELVVGRDLGGVNVGMILAKAIHALAGIFFGIRWRAAKRPVLEHGEYDKISLAVVRNEGPVAGLVNRDMAGILSEGRDAV